MSKQLQCPKCGSFKLTNTRSLAGIFIIVGLATLVFGIGVVFLIIGLAMLLIPKKYQCLNCQYKLTKEEVKALQKA